jgi:hypothetical protein
MFEQYSIEIINKNNMKRVKFHNIIRVIIIQSKKEYEKEVLWWTLNDLKLAYARSIFELQTLMNRHYNMSLFQAKKILYQPLCYDPSNFD